MSWDRTPYNDYEEKLNFEALGPSSQVAALNDSHVDVDTGRARVDLKKGVFSVYCPGTNG